jgi:purine-binding chemotaxis protein CheW
MSIDRNHELQTYLSFRLIDEIFAVNVSKVINILEMSRITKIPKAPVYLRGVINLRGAVLPVIDLRVKFGFPEIESTIDSSIIVLSIETNGEAVLIGTLVDSVKEVLELKTLEIAPPPGIGSKYDSGFIEGMWRTGDQFMMILDIDKIFSVDDIIDVMEFTSQVSPDSFDTAAG